MNAPLASTTVPAQFNLSIFVVVYSENATGEGIDEDILFPKRRLFAPSVGSNHIRLTLNGTAINATVQPQIPCAIYLIFMVFILISSIGRRDHT